MDYRYRQVIKIINSIVGILIEIQIQKSYADNTLKVFF
jgi:hypothetical protein